ncbi:reverse transcriptase domain-containing protein [Tanacetum coccineum]|uniref:Reverse transcriptase domain-containing protein n=1 Tax=Tanacetum coccineum TaxID=301880 RepID=A0ABQ5AQL8_9ASTR
MSQSRIVTLAIRVRSFSDLTAQDNLPIIGKNEWQRLERAWEESKRLEPSASAIKGPHSHTHEHLLFFYRECMRTRRSNYPNSNVTIPRRRRRQVSNIVEPEIRTIVAPMAETYHGGATPCPHGRVRRSYYFTKSCFPNPNHFEIKTNLLQLVQANPFYGRENDNPHAHINSFKRITSTLRFRNVPNDVIKLMMFPYSLEGAAKTWYEKEPPNSILTWEDLVTKFVNQFFPPSKTTHLKNEISRFTQKFEETFSEAWERFKELLRACPHHGFTELTQVDTFYNGLNDNEQDSLNAAAGGNLLSKTTREALNIIENKSKVRYSRNKPNASRINATSSKTDERIDKLADQLSTLVEIVSKKVGSLPRVFSVKAVEESVLLVWCSFLMLRNMQSQINSLKGDLKNEIQNTIKSQQAVMMNQQTTFQNNLQNMICGLFQNQASTSGTLPSNTIPNPKAQIPPPVIPISILEPDVPKTLPKTTPISEPDVPKSLPTPNIPYPSRRDDQKSRDKASNQMEKIFQIFQDLRFDISFADALLLMPRFAPTIKSLLMNKEKLFELAKIPLNENCSAMLLQKLPEKLGDPGKFLLPFDFRVSGTTRSITYPKGLAEEVLVKVGKFHFPTDFVVVDFKADPRVPLILGRSFLRTDRALIDHVKESIEMVNDTCKDNFKKFTDEPALVCLPLSEDDNNEKEKQEVKNLAEPTAKRQTRITPCLKNFKKLFWCFNPGGDNDEIDAFLAIEVPTYIEEGYYDSEGDIIYLESLLSDDTTYNLSLEVFFDHEPQHIENKSDHDTLITFSPKSDPLHHEFTGELITIPPRIVREHEDYISRMSLLCGNSSSQSPENFRTIIESLPTSTTLVEDSDSNREEIDIFSGPNDSIPPGIESDFDSEEDIIDNLLNNDPIPEYERLTFDMEPDVLVINNVNEDECFDPGGGEINVEVDDSFTFVTRTFLPYLTYPEVSPLLFSTKNEDTIFDPGIST